MRIQKTLSSKKFQEKILVLENQFKKNICFKLSSAFWYRKKHQVSLPYTPDFHEDKIHTKA